MILWVCYSDVKHTGEIFQAVSDTGHKHAKNGKMVLESAVYVMCNAPTVYGRREFYVFMMYVVLYAIINTPATTHNEYTCSYTGKSVVKGLCALPSSLPCFHLPFACAQGLPLVKKTVCRPRN